MHEHVRRGRHRCCRHQHHCCHRAISILFPSIPAESALFVSMYIHENDFVIMLQSNQLHVNPAEHFISFIFTTFEVSIHHKCGVSMKFCRFLWKFVNGSKMHKNAIADPYVPKLFSNWNRHHIANIVNI